MRRQLLHLFLGDALVTQAQGFFQREITEAAVRFQREVEANRRIIVGVNEYAHANEVHPVPLLEMDVEGYKRQMERLGEVRRTRDNRAVVQRLTELEQAAKREDVNLMGPLLDSVNEYATLQEMMDVFRDVWGEYEEPVIL
jgi:methylmalonyl-CoA mutase N-terminal domain/subunit